MRTVPLLSSFFQIGYVTKDLDAGMRQLGGIHGIAGFFDRLAIYMLFPDPKKATTL